MMSFLVPVFCGILATGDYDPVSTRWNGLSGVVQMALEVKVDLEFPAVLDWQEHRADSHALFFLSPNRPIPAPKLWAFLHGGGHVVLADDFREGIPVFLELGLVPMDETERFDQAVPVVPEHPLTLGLVRLVTNHAVSFNPVQTPLWAFPGSTRALVFEAAIGEGRLILISDPSLFINDMLHQGDNRSFAMRLLQRLGAGKKTVLVLTDFDERHWPPGSENTGPKSSGFRETLRELSESVQTAALENRMGARVLSVLLLAPFLYAMLWFFSRVPPRPRRRPPVVSTSMEMARLWLRILALQQLVSRQLQLEAPAYTLGRKIWTKLANRLADPQVRERFMRVNLMLERTRGNRESMLGIGYHQLQQMIEDSEEVLDALRTGAGNSAYNSADQVH